MLYFNYFWIFLFFIILNCHLTWSRGGRGGGSRGGSRSGSRSSGGFRSGTSGKIGSSSRYSMWSKSHGLSSSFRYRSSSYYYKRNGINSGLILVSYRYRSTYYYGSDSSFDDISICYNESPLYDRNVTKSPWFVCPWDDPRSRYCCGNEIEERCCRYFDRPGHLTGLIIGCLALTFIFVLTCQCCCKKSKHKEKSDIALVNVDPDKINIDYTNAIIYPPEPVPPPEGNPCPPYPQSFDSDKSPLCGQPNFTETGIIPNQIDNQIPYVPQNTDNTGNPPYPLNPMDSIPQPYSGQQQFNSLSYDESGPQYPLIPPENPPPSYLDVMKQQNF